MPRYYQNNKARILAHHRERNNAETRFKCEICGPNSFRSNYNLQKHLRTAKHARNVRLAREASIEAEITASNDRLNQVITEAFTEMEQKEDEAFARYRQNLAEIFTNAREELKEAESTS